MISTGATNLPAGISAINSKEALRAQSISAIGTPIDANQQALSAPQPSSLSVLQNEISFDSASVTRQIQTQHASSIVQNTQRNQGLEKNGNNLQIPTATAYRSLIQSSPTIVYSHSTEATDTLNVNSPQSNYYFIVTVVLLVCVLLLMLLLLLLCVYRLRQKQNDTHKSDTSSLVTTAKSMSYASIESSESKYFDDRVYSVF